MLRESVFMQEQRWDVGQVNKVNLGCVPDVVDSCRRYRDSKYDDERSGQEFGRAGRECGCFWAMLAPRCNV